MVDKIYNDDIVAGAAVRDSNGKRIDTTYATKEEVEAIVGDINTILDEIIGTEATGAQLLTDVWRYYVNSR